MRCVTSNVSKSLKCSSLGPMSIARKSTCDDEVGERGSGAKESEEKREEEGKEGREAKKKGGETRPRKNREKEKV